MSRAPLVSVIVPARNAAATIGDCLEAAREQACRLGRPFELLVVDDGSTDETAEAAKPLCDALFKMERNSGAAAARNAGAENARGEILVFVDSDVVVMERGIERLVDPLLRAEGEAAVGRYAEKPAVPGVVNLYHNAFTRYHHDLSPEDIDWFWGALSAVKKDAFEKAGRFDQRYRGASAEDIELGRSLKEAGFDILYIPGAEGAHAHRFTLSGMLANDYKKAVLGVKLRLRGRLPERAPGFMRPGNIFAVPLALLAVFLFPYGAFFAPGFLSIPLMALAFVFLWTLYLLNRSFYSYLEDVMGKQFSTGALLHLLQMPVMAAGALAGFAGTLLGRTPYGKPGWI